ncbi:hypothetical protein DSCO28_15140 [Desulfosarcina ovata subsp. sediminis]|uniref:Uncharacterized protein n=1 Tax=Desulfosarcina ovata subsp. sediminis TaxID=885957 RepID=A0A5K7ZFL1_9BACT|nr:hypothetical protein DSCO28_15140 [Desulfosarcina ovata subsp. sediminis]
MNAPPKIDITWPIGNQATVRRQNLCDRFYVRIRLGRWNRLGKSKKDGLWVKKTEKAPRAASSML